MHKYPIYFIVTIIEKLLLIVRKDIYLNKKSGSIYTFLLSYLPNPMFRITLTCLEYFSSYLLILGFILNNNHYLEHIL